MVEDPIQVALRLIKNNKLDYARQILQPLAIESEQARSLLLHIKGLEEERANRPGCFGCFKNSLGCVSGSCLFLIFCMILVCVPFGWVFSVEGRLQNSLYENNGGKGSYKDPIPWGSSVKFRDFEIEILEVLNPADEFVVGLNSSNAITDGQYYALKLRVTCSDKIDNCNARMFQAVIFSQGSQDNMPVFALDLKNESITWQEGSPIEGWLVFRVPTARKIETIAFSTNLNLKLFIDVSSQN
jgi:hypothetical protein